MGALIRTEALEKTYVKGGAVVRALDGVCFAVERSDFITITGPSGSGKTTLLNVLGCLDRPTKGEVYFEDADLTRASDAELSRIRAHRIGFVFQTFFLIPYLSVLENVMLPFEYARGGGLGEAEARERARAAIERVGLAARLEHRPAELSGGEMQRVAIARALVAGPDLILADEPTGNLDQATGAGILDLFESLHAQGATIVMVTHDQAIARRGTRVLAFDRGRLVS